MITGAEKPDAGALRIGDTVKLAHVDQSRDSLPDSATIWEAISGGQDLLELGGRAVNSRAYCAQFGFTGPDQQKKVGVLSGGERNRVHLARLLKAGANVILLDEPTNDLDVNSIRASRRAWRISPVARSSWPMIAGFSIASPRTFSPSRATVRSTGFREITPPTLRTSGGARATTPTAPTGSSTGI